MAKPLALAPSFANHSRTTPPIQSLFLATLRLILYCLGSLIALIGCLRLFRLHGVTTFSFILRLNSKVAFQSPCFLFFVFWGVERRRHCFCSMITWKFNSSAQLNVVTKSLLMSRKGRCKLQVEIFIFLTSPRLIRILALSRVRSRQREITWRNWQYCWAWKGKWQKKKLTFDLRKIFRQLCVEY